MTRTPGVAPHSPRPWGRCPETRGAREPLPLPHQHRGPTGQRGLRVPSRPPSRVRRGSLPPLHTSTHDAQMQQKPASCSRPPSSSSGGGQPLCHRRREPQCPRPPGPARRRALTARPRARLGPSQTSPAGLTSRTAVSSPSNTLLEETRYPRRPRANTLSSISSR